MDEHESPNPSNVSDGRHSERGHARCEVHEGDGTGTDSEAGTWDCTDVSCAESMQTSSSVSSRSTPGARHGLLRGGSPPWKREAEDFHQHSNFTLLNLDTGKANLWKGHWKVEWKESC